MIKINIAAVGKLKDDFFKDALDEYKKRLSRFCELNIYEIAEAPASLSPEQQKAIEGKDILKKIKGLPVLMDIGGDLVSSEELASIIDRGAAEGNSEFTFIIGGSHGVSAEVRAAAAKRISFGRITYPHRLMRVILAEQIYRAFTIIHNTGYHK